MAMEHFRIQFEEKPASCSECVLYSDGCNLNFSSTAEKGCPIRLARDHKPYYMPDNCYTCMFLQPESVCRLTGEKLTDLMSSGKKCPILWLRKYELPGKD